MIRARPHRTPGGPWHSRRGTCLAGRLWWNTGGGACATAVVLLVGLAGRAGGETITNDDVIKLAGAGFTEELILLKIARSDCRFSYSTDELIRLKKAGVTEKVMRVMMDKAGERGRARSVKIRIRVQQLRSPDEAEYNEAVRLLSGMRPADSTAVELLEYLGESADGLRAGVCEALGKLGSPVALKDLMEMLKDRAAPVRLQAARSVQRLAGPDTFDKLIAMLRDSANVRRDGICFALGYLKDRKALPVLTKMLRGPETSENRSAAAFALGLLADRTARPALLHALTEDVYPEVRANAAHAVSKLSAGARGTELTETLAALRKAYDRYARNRVDILEAIRMFKDGRAILLQIEGLNDADRQVRRRAWQGLREITSEHFAQDYEEWNAWWEIKGKLRFPIESLDGLPEPVRVDTHPDLIGPRVTPELPPKPRE